MYVCVCVCVCMCACVCTDIYVYRGQVHKQGRPQVETDTPMPRRKVKTDPIRDDCQHVLDSYFLYRVFKLALAVVCSPPLSPACARVDVCVCVGV